MDAYELKAAREHIADARRSGNPASLSLAAVCEWLIQQIESPSLPEAVAGNASAPVGEKRQPSGVGEPLVLDDLEVALTESIRVDKTGYGVLGPEASDILREFIVSKVVAATVKAYEEGRRAREVGEGLREALDRTIVQKSGDLYDSVDANLRQMRHYAILQADIAENWKKRAEKAEAALAGPAPKPAPPAPFETDGPCNDPDCPCGSSECK